MNQNELVKLRKKHIIIKFFRIRSLEKSNNICFTSARFRYHIFFFKKTRIYIYRKSADFSVGELTRDVAMYVRYNYK